MKLPCNYYRKSMQWDRRSPSPCYGILATCKNIAGSRPAAHTCAGAFLYHWSQCTARSHPVNRLVRWPWLPSRLLISENSDHIHLAKWLVETRQYASYPHELMTAVSRKWYGLIFRKEINRYSRIQLLTEIGFMTTHVDMNQERCSLWPPFPSNYDDYILNSWRHSFRFSPKMSTSTK